MKTLPEIRLTVKNAPEEIIKMLRVVKPTWSENQVELKPLIGGFSCLMYVCFNKEDPQDGVTIRARTNGFEGFPHVKETAFEAKVLHAMHVHGLFPEILATFQNGYCYSYIQGTSLYSMAKPEVSFDEETVRLMARKLAEIHSIKIEGCDYTKTNYFRNLYTILEDKYPASDKLPPGLVSKEELTRELKIVEERALQMGSPLVLCHGDPHPGNVVHNKDKGLVTYVDWEMSQIAYQAADVGYALQAQKMIASNPVMKVQVIEDFDRKYIRFYLEKWFEIHGKKESDVTDEDVDKLDLQASVYRLSSQLFCVMMAMAQMSSALPDHLDPDFMEKFKDAMLKAKAVTEGEANPEASAAIDIKAETEDPTMLMFKGMYNMYLDMKDEIFGKTNRQ